MPLLVWLRGKCERKLGTTAGAVQPIIYILRLIPHRCECESNYFTYVVSEWRKHKRTDDPHTHENATDNDTTECANDERTHARNTPASPRNACTHVVRSINFTNTLCAKKVAH